MKDLNSVSSYANMSFEDMRKCYCMAKMLEEYTFPTKPSSDGYYHIYIKDKTKAAGRRAIKAKTIEELKAKVYNQANKSFREVYELSEKERLTFVKNDEKLYSVRNTQVISSQIYNRFFKGSILEKKPVSEISKSDIEEFCKEQLTKHDVTKKAFLAMRGIIKQTLKYAFEQYYISDNVYERVNYRKFEDMLMSPTPIEDRAHTDEEMDAILQELRNMHKAKPTYIAAWALELQILMGLRRGEVAPLQRSDIYDNYILINKEQITLKKGPSVPKDTDVVVHHTKTYKDRKFPITRDVEEFLAAYLPIIGDSKHLFPAENENGIISNRASYKLYSRICKRLGIELSRDCIKGTHSFRRNQITKVANATGDLVLTSQMFGNSPNVIMTNYYVGYDLKKGCLAMNSRE